MGEPIRPPRTNALWERLRRVHFPGYNRDIVSFGFVKELRGEGTEVRVRFEPNTRRDEKVQAMVDGIERELTALAGVESVRVDVGRPGEPRDTGGTLTPLQAELLDAGSVPEPDQLGMAVARPDVAPDAGYRDQGPDPLPGPPAGGKAADRSAPNERAASEDGRTSSLRVLQWEIHPTDDRLPGKETDVVLDGWEYHMWWKVHPAGLAYASIHAMKEDEEEGGKRAHPVGRTVAVNLVYDTERCAAVAIYGVARDFRPFVEAFRQAFEETSDEETS